MSSYNIECFLKDFANRTIKNLKFVEKYAFYENDLYEVTQLINSLLGLIIIPVETYKKKQRLSDEKLRKLSGANYNSVKNLIKICHDEKRLYSDYWYDNDGVKVDSFIAHLRNAIAHSGNHGIRFYPISENGKISNIMFFDEKGEHEKKNQEQKPSKVSVFCVKLTIAELRALVEDIVELYCRFESSGRNIAHKQKDYRDDIERLEQLLKGNRGDVTKSIFHDKI